MAKIYSWLDTPDGGFVPPQVRLDNDGHPVEPASYTYLCAIDGVHYGAIADGVKMPRQKKQTGLKGPLSFKKDTELFKLIRKHAMPCREINSRLGRAIRDQYSLDDELQSLRENDPDYKAFVKGLVDEARAEKTALGLYPATAAQRTVTPKATVPSAVSAATKAAVPPNA